MGSYVGFIPLDNMTDAAIDAVAQKILASKDIVVCHYQDIPIIARLYERLSQYYPDYICVHKKSDDAYERVVQSCDSLYIYWDGISNATKKITSIKGRPDKTYLVLPSGYMIHFHDDYLQSNEETLNEWLAREDVKLPETHDIYVPWDGCFANEYFFLSALSTLVTPDNGYLYPSLMHALISRSIREEGYRNFYNSTRIPSGAKIIDWIRDFNIDVEEKVITSPVVISELLASRYEYNKAFFGAHPVDINVMSIQQSYETDSIIAAILKGESLEDIARVAQSSINYMTGDIFTNSKNGIIFIPVNCKGSMGAGLALDTAERYPEIEPVYKKACKKGDLAIGKPIMITTKDNQALLLFPTKDDWKKPSELSYIETGFQYFYQNIVQSNQNIPLHIPKLGCGLGELQWEDVNPLIEKYFTDYGSQVYVYI